MQLSREAHMLICARILMRDRMKERNRQPRWELCEEFIYAQVFKHGDMNWWVPGGRGEGRRASQGSSTSRERSLFGWMRMVVCDMIQ